MDIASVGSLNTALSMAQDGDAIGTLMLKKALKIQEQSAMQLIQSLPQPSSSNPPNLGNSVDVRA